MLKRVKISHTLIGAYAFIVTLFFIILFIIYLIFLNFAIYSLEQGAYQYLDGIAKANHNKIEATINSSVRTYLRAISEKNREITANYYELFMTEEITEEEAVDRVGSLLLSQVIGKDGYIFVLNSEHKMLVHPDKSVEGRDMSGQSFIREMVKMKRGYYEYKWENEDKIVYMEYFEPWDFIICISTYMEDLMFLVDKEALLNEMAEVKIGEKGRILIIDLKGELVLAVDRTLEGQNIFDTQDRDGKYYIREIINKREGTTEYSWKGPGQDRFHDYVITYKFIKQVGWIIGARNFKEEFYKGVGRIKNIFRIALTLVIIILSLTSLLLILLIRRVINQPLTLLNEISNIEGDLTRRLPESSGGELGQVAVHFNKFLSLMNSIIVNVKRSITISREMGQQLSAASTESTLSLKEIGQYISSLKERAKELDSEIKSVERTTEEVNSFAGLVEKELSKQSAEFSRSSSSIEEMTASITNVARISEAKVAVAEGLEKIAVEGQKEMDDTLKNIRVITDSSQLIMDMLKVINKIASETGLLAMNAAIEAAHAGEAGRGFAIVADEIRRLSEEAGANSKEITKSLKEIIGYIHISEKSSTKTDSYFKEIVFGVKEVTGAMAEIKESMKELSTGSRLIVEALEVIVAGSSNIDERAGAMTEKTDNIVTSLQNISLISSDNKKGMEEIGQLAERVAGSGEEISRAEKENRLSIEETEKIVNRLKTVESDKNVKKV